MKTSREIFAENLRTKLIERNKKQVDLAKYLGTTKATVTHWVNGENMPRMDAIDRICLFLRCEADDLLKDHSKPVGKMCMRCWMKNTAGHSGET